MNFVKDKCNSKSTTVGRTNVEEEEVMALIIHPVNCSLTYKNEKLLHFVFYVYTYRK